MSVRGLLMRCEERWGGELDDVRLRVNLGAAEVELRLYWWGQAESVAVIITQNALASFELLMHRKGFSSWAWLLGKFSNIEVPELLRAGFDVRGRDASPAFEGLDDATMNMMCGSLLELEMRADDGKLRTRFVFGELFDDADDLAEKVEAVLSWSARTAASEAWPRL